MSEQMKNHLVFNKESNKNIYFKFKKNWIDRDQTHYMNWRQEFHEKRDGKETLAKCHEFSLELRNFFL